MVDIAMMVAGVGMQFFNNYANNKKNAELQAKQREYQIASAEHDFERMRRIQAESARIALEMEAELHQERMSDINNQYDTLLENFAHGFSISNWPLNVLPFIMKGESFGSLINGTSNSINMHCILTPSNCEWFNEIFYDDLDLRLEAEMNNHWNAQSSHPIVYYGGGWNRRTMKKGFSFPEQIDLNDIDLLKVNLKNVPMMVITPYFDPWLHFRVELWGMGKDSSVPFRIDIPHGDIDYDTRVFSYDYNKENKEGIYEDDFQNVTIEEFVPYLERLIGFVADKYFWSLYNIIPCLPVILKKNNSMMLNTFTQGYLGMVNDSISDITTNTAQKLYVKHELIESIKPIISSTDEKNIEEKFIQSAKEVLYSQENISYQDAIKLIIIERDKELIESWVDIGVFDEDQYDVSIMETFDLSLLVQNFQSYIESNIDRFDKDSISLYIEHYKYKEFKFHVYDNRTKQVFVAQDSFNKKIISKRILYMNNIKSIFKHTEHGSILCRYQRIPILIDKIRDNTLTF